MKLKFTIITAVLYIILPSLVYANCNNEEINELKEISKNVEVTYELNPNLSKEELKNYSKFEDGIVNVIITGLTEDLYVYFDLNSYNYSDSNNGVLIIENVMRGNKKLEIYSSKCEKKLRTTNFMVPTYNIYSDDEICKNYKDKLSICNTWYEYDVDVNKVKLAINNYEKTLLTPQPKKKTIIDVTKDFILSYYLYILIGIALVVFIIIFIMIKRKRSELV